MDLLIKFSSFNCIQYNGNNIIITYLIYTLKWLDLHFKIYILKAYLFCVTGFCISFIR